MAIKQLILILVLSIQTFGQQNNEKFVNVINRLVEAMNTSNYEAMVSEYDSGMLTAFPLNKTTIFFKNLENQYGKVSRIEAPQIKGADHAICVMFFERGAQVLNIYLTDQGKIKGFLFTTHIVAEPTPTPKPTETQPTQIPPTTAATDPKPEQPTTIVKSEPQPVPPVVADKQQTVLYPPFKGTWAVIYGGELREGAAQRNLLQQQYAYEFSATNEAGLRYNKDGKTNEEYYGYGKEVLAPADGIVVETIDGIRENSPGLRNPYAAIGNAIIIQHTNREYSVLSYLKQGSVRVKVGENVKRGQVIALCGNSGNSTEPVIHYHLQDSPFMQTAKGLKFYFERVTVFKDGTKELKLNHLPMSGEILSAE